MSQKTLHPPRPPTISDACSDPSSNSPTITAQKLTLPSSTTQSLYMFGRHHHHITIIILPLSSLIILIIIMTQKLYESMSIPHYVTTTLSSSFIHTDTTMATTRTRTGRYVDSDMLAFWWMIWRLLVYRWRRRVCCSRRSPRRGR